MRFKICSRKPPVQRGKARPNRCRAHFGLTQSSGQRLWVDDGIVKFRLRRFWSGGRLGLRAVAHATDFPLRVEVNHVPRNRALQGCGPPPWSVAEMLRQI